MSNKKKRQQTFDGNVRVVTLNHEIESESDFLRIEDNEEGGAYPEKQYHVNAEQNAIVTAGRSPFPDGAGRYTAHYRALTESEASSQQDGDENEDE